MLNLAAMTWRLEALAVSTGPQNVGCMGCLGSTELGEPIMVAVFHSIATLMSGNVP